MRMDTKKRDKMIKLLFFLIVLFQQKRNVFVASSCEPCNNPNGWNGWTEYGPCQPVNSGDLCFKKETRRRHYPGIFACPDCNDQYETRRCGQCDHNCTSTTGVCSCNHGYILKADQTSCEDINECNTNDGGCQHECTNTKGSYTCSCKDGYDISTHDQKFCAPKSCGALTLNCPPNSYKDQSGDACKKVTTVCSNNFLFNSTCTLSCPTGYDLATIENTSGSAVFAEFIKDADFNLIISDAQCILDNAANNAVKWNLQKSIYEKLYCRRKNDAPRNLKLSNNIIKEHQPEDTMVGTISANDDGNDTVVYTIENTEGGNSFYIEGTDLKSSVIFNLKNMASKVLTVKIRATDNASLYNEQNFQIQIQNINDPPAEILLSNSTFNDLTNVGDIIGNLSAIDYDEKPISRKSDFIWTMRNNGNGHFALQGHSIILAKQYDSNQDITTSVIIQCSDKDPINPKSSIQKIYLSRRNINNPVTINFTALTSYLMETAEVGTVYGTLRIVDTENNTVVIRDKSDVTTQEKFSIRPVQCSHQSEGTVCNTEIVLIGDLDYETRNKYTLLVEAADSHNEQILTSYDIIVANVNEAPYQLQFQDLSEVDEGSSDDILIAALLVKDVDSKIKSCQVTDTQSPFKMRGFNVVLKTNKVLNFEIKDMYTLEVSCWDDGNPSLEIKNQTTVYILDKNEIPTSPCPTSNNIKINHTTSIGTKIMVLASHDPDNENILKQKLTYALSNSQEVPFKIENNQVVINGRMSPNKIYNLKVVVSDDGTLLQHQNGGLVKYNGRANNKEYTCIVTTNAFSPCEYYHEYKNGRCVCKHGYTGFECDRSPTRCNDASCTGGQSCPEFTLSPTNCVNSENQLPMLLNIKFNKFLIEEYRYDLETYIKDILEGNANGKSLKNLKGSKQKRRDAQNLNNSTKYYIEAVDPINVRTLYTYVKFIPYNVGNQYSSVDAASLCPLFENTDVRCVNDQDCKTLETIGIRCYHEFGKTGTDFPVNDKNGGNSTPNYVYILIAVIIAALIILVLVVMLVKRFRNRKNIEKEEPVVFNNHLNTIPSFASGGNQTLRDIHRLKQVTDIEVFDNQVFRKPGQNSSQNRNQFQLENPSFGIERNSKDNEDGGDKDLSFPADNAPLYASIGKSAKNPLYQSSGSNRYEVTFSTFSEDKHKLDETKVELTPEEKAKEKGDALEEHMELKTSPVKRGSSLNEYRPNIDYEKDKNFKKKNF